MLIVDLSADIKINTPHEPERWAVIPEWPFYEASTHGRIRSWKFRTTLPTEPRILRPAPNPGNGYLQVVLRYRGAVKTLHVHTLVLNAHAGPKPDGWEVRHLNGDKLDNRLENLGWGSHQANMDDQLQHGTRNFGERNGQAVLTQETVRAARADRAAGDSLDVLARRYNVGLSTIQQAVTGKTWGWLPGAVPSQRNRRASKTHLEVVR